jgi:hypothetical protein
MMIMINPMVAVSKSLAPDHSSLHADTRSFLSCLHHLDIMTGWSKRPPNDSLIELESIGGDEKGNLKIVRLDTSRNSTNVFW